MALRIAATASAWARMFSPVSSVSLAISGSAKALARASACGWSGRLSAVAVTMDALGSGVMGVMGVMGAAAVWGFKGDLGGAPDPAPACFVTGSFSIKNFRQEENRPPC